MTTEQPDATLNLDPAGTARPLRRRSADRVIGGVAGGLGDYLNVDPVLFRAAFAGLVIFGGAGLVIYALGWLLIPEAGQQRSIAELAVRQLAHRSGWLMVLVLVVAAFIVLRPWRYEPYFRIPGEVFWGLAIALAGVLLMLWRDRSEGGTTAVEAGMPPAAAMGGWAAQRERHAPPERSPMGWFLVAAALAGVGILAIGDVAAPVAITPAQYLGAGLLVLGLGLVLAAWWGRARSLILLGILVLPIAIVASFVTVPLTGGVSDDTFRPANVAELQSSYRLAGGRLTLDLAGLEAGDLPITIDASVGIGNLYVMIPRGAGVLVDGKVNGGHLFLLGREHDGTRVADRVSEAGWYGAPRLVLNLEVGLGAIVVDRVDVTR